MATVPFLYDISARTGWYTPSDLSAMVAIAEMTPGPIGVNMATYVGYRTAGLMGAILAPVALVTPAFIIILLASRVIDRLQKNPNFQSLFYGLRPASVGLIAAACFSICAVSLFSLKNGVTVHIPSIILFAVVLIALNLKKLNHVSPIVFVALSAAAGILFHITDG